MPADRAAIAEVVTRIALAHDRDAIQRNRVRTRLGRIETHVAVREIASFDQLDAHRPKVARADGVAERVHVLARLWLVPFDRHRAVPLVALEEAHLCKGGGADSGHGADPLDELFVELLRANRGVAAERRRDVEGHEVVDVQAEVEQTQIAQAADEQPCADEQQNRDGDLCDHERLAKANAARSSSNRADLIFQGRGEIRPRGAERRHEAEDDSRQQRQREVERQHAIVE